MRKESKPYQGLMDMNLLDSAGVMLNLKVLIVKEVLIRGIGLKLRKTIFSLILTIIIKFDILYLHETGLVIFPFLGGRTQMKI